MGFQVFPKKVCDSLPLEHMFSVIVLKCGLKVPPCGTAIPLVVVAAIGDLIAVNRDIRLDLDVSLYSDVSKEVSRNAHSALSQLRMARNRCFRNHRLRMVD
jgi:hypothetical protein